MMCNTYFRCIFLTLFYPFISNQFLVITILASYMVRAFNKLLRNFLATSRISSNFLHSEQFLSLSSNSEISEQVCCLKK